MKISINGDLPNSEDNKTKLRKNLGGMGGHRSPEHGPHTSRTP